MKHTSSRQALQVHVTISGLLRLDWLHGSSAVRHCDVMWYVILSIFSSFVQDASIDFFQDFGLLHTWSISRMCFIYGLLVVQSVSCRLHWWRLLSRFMMIKQFASLCVVIGTIALTLFSRSPFRHNSARISSFALIGWSHVHYRTGIISDAGLFIQRAW